MIIRADTILMSQTLELDVAIAVGIKFIWHARTTQLSLRGNSAETSHKRWSKLILRLVAISGKAENLSLMRLVTFTSNDSFTAGLH